MSSTKIHVMDPHFHFFDLSETTRSGHDAKVMSLPEKKELYDVRNYEEDMGALPEVGLVSRWLW